MTASLKPDSKKIRDENSEILEIADWFFSVVVPDPEMTVSAWSDAHRYLSSKASAEPGRWRTSRTPYLREIMDNLSATSSVQETDVMAGAQLGKTEAGNNWVGYVMDMAPSSMLLVQPTVDIAKRFSNQRLAPLVNDSPRLREKVSENKSREKKNTILTKDFPGGTLMLAGSNSAAGLKSMPIKNLFCDEIDTYPEDVDGEGDPIALAQARCRTFARRKMLFTSTPTVRGKSRIESLYLETDQRKYFVPCPHCNHMHVLEWKNFIIPKFEDNSRDWRNAHMACPECGSVIENHHKTEMMKEAGFGGLAEWRPTCIDKLDQKRRGYQLSALYSPVGFFSWPEIARQWGEAQGNPLKLKEFVNTVLAETWEERGERIESNSLMVRCEPFKSGVLPDGCHVVTVGCDVQANRIELEFIGWGRGEESWSLDYRIIPGDPVGDEIWKLLDIELARTWIHKSGVQIRAFRGFIDSGNGSHTSRIYDYVRPRQAMNIYACKGSSDNKNPVCGTKSYQKKSEIDLYLVGTHVCKDLIYGRLGITEYGPGYCHFPIGRSQEYFEQLTAEELRTKAGVRSYVKIRQRNEALDCRVYGIAALYSIGMKIDDIANSFEAQAVPVAGRVIREG